MNLYTSKQTKILERLAIKEQRFTAFSLMQEAANFSFNTLLSYWPDTKQVFTFCGKGNNAGDGYLVASLAKEVGLESFVIQISNQKNLSQPSIKALKVSRSLGVKFITLKSFTKMSLNRAVLVDALLGTGIKGNVRKNVANAIQIINQKSTYHPVLSIDIPSGICADTGKELGTAVMANLTTTFIGRKRGCYTSAGRSNSGTIEFSNLGIKKTTLNKVTSNYHILDMEKSLAKILNRPKNSHKGDFGHTLVIGGDSGYGGAAILASKAAIMSGSGLVSLATQKEHISAALSSCPELMVNGVTSGQDLEDLLAKANSIVIGPGLGQSAWSEQMLQKTFIEAKKRNLPVVMDADALNLLSTLKLASGTPKKLVITPHPGEAAKLLKRSIEAIQQDRFKSVMDLEKKLGAISVLKGSGSLVCSRINGIQKIGVCSAGNPGMAKGGVGDILSGLIGSFISQGLSLTAATEAAVDIHSKAADIAELELGELGLLPSDVINNIRYLLKSR